MKTPYNFTIIYNPQSTGRSVRMAKDFEQQLQKLYSSVKIDLIATKRSGHAEEIAYKAASAKKSCVIVSVSGDGGYHEVINGAMRAVREKRTKPICAVLPAGNANDHYKSTAKRPLLRAIKADGLVRMDLLEVKVGARKRYAHSYIGLGITPLVAIELNRHSLSRLKEAWLATITFWRLRPFVIEFQGQKTAFDSLVITNVHRMAKYLKLSQKSDPTDGKFEVIKWPHSSKLRLLGTLFSSLFGRGPKAQQLQRLKFRILKDTPLQLDGEIMTIDKDTNIQVSVVPGKLRTFR